MKKVTEEQQTLKRGVRALKRHRYQAPQIVSAENLEAAAMTCNPPGMPFGKVKNPPFCGRPGS